MTRTVRLAFLGLLFAGVGTVAFAAPGEWPESRQNARLTSEQPLPGAMSIAPEIIATYDLGRGQPAITRAAQPDGSIVGLAIVAGALHCFDQAGSTVWTSHPAGLNFTGIKDTGDFDGDGQMEIALEAGRPGTPYGAAALVSLANGELRWQYDVEPMSYDWHLYVGAYLPGTTGRQLIVIMHAYPPDTKNGYIAFFDFAAPGESPRQRWRYDFDAYTCFPTLLQTDLEGDGARELVVETHSRMWILDTPTGLLKQFYAWSVDPANTRSYGHVAFTDLNGDGLEDFLCIANFAQHHEALLNKGGRLEKAWHHGWPESVTTGKVATVWAEPPNIDVDGDGSQEIVLSMFNSENEGAWLLRVYDAVTGELKYRMPGVFAVSCVDVDGNGSSEIMVNGSSDPTRTQTSGAKLFAIENGAFEERWSDPEGTALAPRARRRQPANAEAPSARFTKSGEVFALEWDVASGYTSAPWSKPEKSNRVDFAAVPAVVGGSATSLLAGDLLDEAGNEIVLYQAPTVALLRVNGQQLEAARTFTSSSEPIIVDLNGDGRRELVLSDAKPDATPTMRAITPSQNDAELWSSHLPVPERAGLPHARPAYMRAGRFTGKPTPDLYAWFGTPLGRSVVIDGLTGALVWEKGEVPKNERYWGATTNSASVYDFNADGGEDVVFTNPDYYCIADGKTGELLLGPSFPPTIFNQPCQGLYTFPAILDRVGDTPLVSLVNGHYFLATMTIDAKPSWYSIPLPGENRVACEAFLQMPDKDWLIGYGRQNGRFTCVNAADGKIRWEHDVQASTSDAIVLDVDGDGAKEFVFGTSHGAIFAIGDSTSGARLVWQVKVPGGVGPIIAADVDGNGTSEIIASLTDGRVAVFGVQP